MAGESGERRRQHRQGPAPSGSAATRSVNPASSAATARTRLILSAIRLLLPRDREGQDSVPGRARTVSASLIATEAGTSVALGSSMDRPWSARQKYGVFSKS